MAKKARQLVALLRPFYDSARKFRVFTKLETEVHIPISRIHRIFEGDYHDGLLRLLIGLRLVIPAEDFKKIMIQFINEFMNLSKEELEEILWSYSKEARNDPSVPNKKTHFPKKNNPSK